MWPLSYMWSIIAQNAIMQYMTVFEKNEWPKGINLKCSQWWWSLHDNFSTIIYYLQNDMLLKESKS